MNNFDNIYHYDGLSSWPYANNPPMTNPGSCSQISGWCNPGAGNGAFIPLRDYGPAPFVVDIDAATKQNTTYRTALWTGNHLQLTLMSINVGDDIGLEVHPTLDQFIRIEQGQGLVQMGNTQYNLDFQCNACDGYAIFIPAGTWHNLTNTGNIPIKLYSIYAPPQHPFGTVQVTKPVETQSR